ncbi:hypothetical protein M7I_7984 [Glarea lozoyensis 74030]|uniref:Uncharacterized protein n=1 Tax=Glarea lozoyensis (strain ATCC 74030 / MF5533) TaxID=1104152 RepID=H0EYS5_GLAL7|nr:hypothetical protein M7I_7984 [Glarea lozoyensis 74030]
MDTRSPKYTPTGLSTEEIIALGDFPAYDILTGVPNPSPFKEFNPLTAVTRPYRPLRWNYHQTMSLTKMEPDWWLEIDKTYPSMIAERQKLFRLHGNKSQPPLHILLNNVPEDFAIVLRNEVDGMYYMRAGVICSSLGWNVSTKLGLQLRDIHGSIPDYKEKMQFSMDRYFSKMPTNAPIQRGSWGLEVGCPLFMPPGDPHEKLREVQSPDLKIEDCNLRVDWQTLRRMPLSGAIVFNFTALFTPVTEFRDEPKIPALLIKILREGKRSLMEYKNTWHVEHMVLPALEEWAREQVEKGVVKADWEVATLDESPYFEGWEEKWRRAQGY